VAVARATTVGLEPRLKAPRAVEFTHMWVMRHVKRFRDFGRLTRVQVFSLRVVRQRESWPEKSFRTTRWFTAEEAARMVSDPELGNLIATFVGEQLPLISSP
jgi:hypothetical protein